MSLRAASINNSIAMEMPPRLLATSEVSNLPAQTSQTCPSPVPFEVFLNIVDALIFHAERATKPMEFCFYLSPDGTPEAKLEAQVSERFTNPMWTAGRRMERFRMLRLALQLSSRTRAMVHRKFRRLLAWNPAIQDKTPIWVYPDIDRFNPILCRMPEDCLSLSKALLQPTELDDVLVQCLESVQGLPREFLNEEYNVDMDTLLSLPRLREVTLDSAMLRICSNRLELPDDDHPHPSDDIITVPNNLFPSLGRWIQWKTQGIESFCRRARERDIRVFVGAGGNSDVRKLELVLTADGVRCKLISPICTCDL